MLKIKIILGSTREGRMSEKVGKWILSEAEKKDGLDLEILDLKDYPLPFFNEAMSPMMMKEPYTEDVPRRWADKIREGDAFIIIAPEYNHGYPAVLKNALDYLYAEWARKPVGFVGYGSVSGARSIEQLRQVIVQLQMASVPTSVNIAGVWTAFDESGAPKDPSLSGHAGKFLDDLIWWGNALKEAR